MRDTPTTMEAVTAMTEEPTMSPTTMVESMQPAEMETPMEESSSMMVLQGVDAFDMY